jgi:putative transposase
MARPLRLEFPGALYHSTSRGNDKKAIFRDDEDRATFLRSLASVNERYHWLCHAYCLMNNHYHLVVETPDGNLSKGMRQLNGVYTQAFNKRHRKTGHVFQGRYKAILLQRESHLLEVCRYVALNPVRAQAVKVPEAWQWSSYRGTEGSETPHSCLTIDWVLAQFGSRRGVARRRYRDFVHSRTRGAPPWTEVQGQLLLGDSEFVERFKNYVKQAEHIKEIPRSQRYLGRPSLDALFKDTKARGKLERDRRIYEAVQHYGYSEREVADYLNLHYSTVSRLISSTCEGKASNKS